MGSPTLSVVIPTFNRRELVVQSIESVLAAQGDVEIVVVDDGSSDGTAELLGALYGDRIRLLVQANKGRSCARNAGVVVAEGDYVCFLDSDDLWEPWHVRQFASASSTQQAGHVYSAPVALWNPVTGASTRVRRRSPFRTRDLREASLVGTVLPLEGLFIPREIVQKIGGFDERLSGSEDWEFLVRLVRSAPIACLSCPSVRARKHEGRSMADVEWDITWRKRAASVVSARGERILSARDLALVQAGTARYCAARLYEAGRMREARLHLRIARSQTGRVEGWRATWRLTVQTRLGPVPGLIRRIRNH